MRMPNQYRYASPTCRPRGFTLVELMITLAVLAIAVAIGLPSFREFGVRMNVTETTNEIVRALNVARTEAVRRGVNVVVVPNGTWTQGWIVRPEATAEVLYSHVALASGYTLKANSTGGGSASQVTFRATGALAVATSFDFSVCRPTFSPGDAESRWIRVEGSGLIRSQRNTANGQNSAGTC